MSASLHGTRDGIPSRHAVISAAILVAGSHLPGVICALGVVGETATAMVTRVEVP